MVFAAGSLYLGTTPAASGMYNLTGGSLFGGNPEFIGYSGSGCFTQSGGTNSVSSNNLVIGANLGGSGTYSLSGSGLISASIGVIGSSGNGNCTQSGGNNSASVELVLGGTPAATECITSRQRPARRA